MPFFQHSLGRGVFTLEVNSREFARGLQGASGAFRQLMSPGGGLGVAGVMIAATKAAIGLAQATLAVVVPMVELTAKVRELENRLDLTFGQQAAKVREFSESLAVTIGRSTTAIRHSMTQVGAFFRGMDTDGKLGSERLAILSELVVRLGEDIATVNKDFTREEIFTKLFSGLTGESESVERLGINLKESAVSAELLALGIDGGVRSANEMQKLMARLSLMFRSLEQQNILGQAEMRAEGLAAQIERMRGLWRDIQIEVGGIITSLVEQMSAIETINQLLTATLHLLRGNDIAMQIFLNSLNAGLDRINEYIFKVTNPFRLVGFSDIIGLETFFKNRADRFRNRAIELYGELNKEIAKALKPMEKPDLSAYARLFEGAGKDLTEGMKSGFVGFEDLANRFQEAMLNIDLDQVRNNLLSGILDATQETNQILLQQQPGAAAPLYRGSATATQ